MAVIVNLQLNVIKGREEEFPQFIAGVLPDTRAFEGCNWVYFTTNSSDPTSFEFFSSWDSKEDQLKYMQWRQENGSMEVFASWLEGEPVFRYLDVEQSY